MTETPAVDYWLPTLSAKQKQVFNCYNRFVLVCGGRYTGKSIAVCHRVWRHLWETPNAHVGLFAVTTKSAKEGGSWQDLVTIGQEWVDSGMIGDTDLPIAYTSDNNGIPGPKIDGTTRTAYFAIRNKHGGESKCRLYSLDNENEIESKVKNYRFSMIWFIELSNFKNKDVFRQSHPALRQFGVRDEEMMWIADTNPAKEGKDSWIYKLFYQRKSEDGKESGLDLKVIEIQLDDNPFITEKRRLELEENWKDDPGEYERNYEGQWVRGKGGQEKVFAPMIIPGFHFVDDAIDVAKETRTLITGWDLGHVNHGIVMWEQRLVNGYYHWNLLDELETIGEKVTIEEVAYEFWQKMKAIEGFYNRRFLWKHWSDDTALNTWRSAIGGYDQALVLKATNGEVELEAAEKPKGSVMHSVKIIRRLIRDKRLFIGKNCPASIRMLEELEYSDDLGQEIDETGPLKHIFDAFRYPIYMESRTELEFARPDSRGSGLISVG